MLPEYKCPITLQSEVPVILDHASSVMTKENSVCAYHPSACHTHLNASHDCTFTCLGISCVPYIFFQILWTYNVFDWNNRHNSYKKFNLNWHRISWIRKILSRYLLGQPNTLKRIDSYWFGMNCFPNCFIVRPCSSDFVVLYVDPDHENASN